MITGNNIIIVVSMEYGVCVCVCARDRATMMEKTELTDDDDNDNGCDDEGVSVALIVPVYMFGTSME